MKMFVRSASTGLLFFAAASFAHALPFITSFESNTLGPLDEQASGFGSSNWIADPSMTVTNARAKSGTQSVVWNGGQNALNWFPFPTPVNGTFSASVSVFVESGSNDRLYGLQIWNEFTLSSTVAISPNGDVRATGNGAPWTVNPVGNIGSAVGRWVDISILYTTGASSASVNVGGQNFSITDAIAIGQATEVGLYSDFILDPNSAGVAYFDDYAVVPEPATLAVLAGLGLLAARRRKA